MVAITGDDGVTYNFHVDAKLKHFLDEKVIKRINTRDKDYVMLISGYEGSGKSTFASQVCKYVDNNFNLDNVVFSPEDFKQAIITAGKGEAVLYDEAVTGLTAGGSITKVGRLLKSLMMQMRQKNLFVVVVIPSVFELNKYAVLHRAMCLFHVYEKKNRYAWVGYNKADTKTNYILGKKTNTMKVKSRFIGRFLASMGLEKESYLIKKQEAFDKEDEVAEKVNKFSIQRDAYLKIIKDILGNAKRAFDAQKDIKYPLSYTRVMEIGSEQAEVGGKYVQKA